MENTSETKGFYEYRTTLRALSDGVSLMTKNALMLLKATWPILLIVSLLGAWYCQGVTSITEKLLLGVVLELSDLGLKIALPFVILLIGLLCYYALVYSVFSRYVEKGFMPTLTRKRYQLCPKLTKFVRFFIAFLWVAFVSLVYLAIVIALVTVSKWTLVLTIPIGIFLEFWLKNQLTGYVLISDTLFGSIRRSFGLTLKGFGSFLVVTVVLGLILGVVGMICLAPSLVSGTIYVKSQISLAEGDNGDLPGYFMTVYFLACTLSSFLMLLLEAIEISCWSMVYGAVSTRLKKA